MSYKNYNINYLIDYDNEYPLRFAKNKNDLDENLNNYCQPVRLYYDPQKDIFKKYNSKNINNNFVKSLFTRFYNKNINELYVQINFYFDNIDLLKIGANQIHIVDLKENKIAHLLIPNSDSEWFINEIDTQLNIQKEKFTINTPLIQNCDKSVPYFITDYIKGNSLVKLTATNHDEIVRKLFKFYSEQESIIIKNNKEEFDRIVLRLKENMELISSNNTQVFNTKIKELIDKIQINGISKSNRNLFFSEIVHGDLNYKENIIKTIDGKLFFIDWEMSRSANILYDYFYMLLYELSQQKNIENSILFNYFSCSQMKLLSQEVNKQLDLQLDPNAILNYFCLAILDMFLYKILIIKKKRIQPMNKIELKKRFLSLEKYLDKIYVILDKAIKNNDNINEKKY
jgi:thiamine kinase-like enzyme